MKKLLPLLAGMALLSTATAQATVIYGYQTYEPVTEYPLRGPICFDTSDPGTPTIIADCSDMGVVYGGYYYNYHWYGQGIVKGTQSSVEGLYDIDMTTGKRTRIAGGDTKAIDLTYDYSTGKVWGVRSGNRILVELNPATGSCTSVAYFNDGTGNELYILAMAASLDGTLYAVSPNNNLYTIDKTTGNATLVGELGVDAGFDQTMAFDYATGTLYWANNLDYVLYTIDTKTGAATAIGSIGFNKASSMASLFIPYIDAPAGSPDRVTGVSGTSTGSAIELSWTAPAITVRGATLTDLTGIIIERDGTQIADIKCTAADAGKAMTYTDNAPTAGKVNTYRFIPYNSHGNGGVDTTPLSIMAGKDRPGLVGNLTFEQGDGSAILTWEAPTAGAASGQFSPDDITGYNVYRNNTKVATLSAAAKKFEDKTSFGTYNYSVTAVSAVGEGDRATVEKVMVKPADWIVMTNGTALVTPGTTYKFYDQGGPNGNYTNSSLFTLTIAPSTANAYICAEFTKFGCDTYGDYLMVYQGAGTDGELIGKFAATAVPAGLLHLEATAADGALTFVFYSDVIESGIGWEATVTATAMNANDLEATQLTLAQIAVQGEKTTAAVTVANKGVNAANNYTVDLMGPNGVIASAKGPALASRQRAVVEIEYTPATEGTIALTARVNYDGDDNTANNTTAEATQTVMAAGTSFVDLFTASPSEMYVVPASFLSIESVCEMLLIDEAIKPMAGKNFTSISFPLATVSTAYSGVPFSLYVGESELTGLETGSIPPSALTKVFEGKVDITPTSEDLTFTFETPFAYTGKNLVVLLHKHNSATDNSGVTFRGDYAYDAPYGKCTRFDSRFGTDYPELDLESTFGYSAQTQRPDMRLVFSGSGSVTDVALGSSQAVAVNGSTVTAYAPVTIYTPAGAAVVALEAGQSASLAPGIYLAASGSTTLKIAIR